MTDICTYTFQFDTQAGATMEIYTATFTTGDFDNDGLDDIRVEITHDTDSGGEETVGIAFDFDALHAPDLAIVDVTLVAGDYSGDFVTFVDPGGIGSDGGATTDPGFNTSGQTDAPYDAAILLDAPGGNDGAVAGVSFVLTSDTVSLDISDLLGGGDWYVRTQATEDGGSAKTTAVTAEFICDDDDDDDDAPGAGNTPGFWKNHQEVFEGETGLSYDSRYEDVFGVDVLGGRKLSDDPTLIEALSARGGGEAALLRASTAAYANIASDEVNYAFGDDETLGIGIIESYGLDVDAFDFAEAFDTAETETLDVLTLIDTDGDSILSLDELTAAVQGAFADQDHAALASALDVMNNMPSVETDTFVF